MPTLSPIFGLIPALQRRLTLIRCGTRILGGVAFGVALLTVSCGGESSEADAGSSADSTAAVLAPPLSTHTSNVVITASPTAGAPGSSVSVHASGLEPSTSFEVGFGAPRSEFSVLGQGTADANGELTLQAQIPSWATVGNGYRFTVAPVNQPPLGTSGTFWVPGPDGVIKVKGRVTDEGVECLAMRTDENELYSLVGETGGAKAGDVVEVEATVAEMSTCMQGATLSVKRLSKGS